MNKIARQIFPKRQRGVSLPVALILLVPLTLLGITLANRNNLEELMAGAQRDGQQALMNAESGLAMGQQSLEAAVLARVEANKNDPDNPDYELSVNATITLADPYTVVSYGNAALSNYGLTEGTVTVVVMDNDDGDGDPTQDVDGQVILRSTGNYGGYLDRSGERVVEAVVALNFNTATGSSNAPPLTIFTEEWLDLNGNPDFYGPQALVHSNAYVNIGGTTRIDGSIQQAGDSTSGTYSQAVDGVWGTWEQVSATTGVSRIPTPFVYPPIYKGLATHYMTSDCQVWNGVPGGTSLITGEASVALVTNAKDNEWNGWKCSYDGSDGGLNDKWELLGDYAITGFYYVEGVLVINGNTGTEGNPLNISIVAEGMMDVSGNPFITPYYEIEGDYFTSAEANAYETLIRAAIDAGEIYPYMNRDPWEAVLKNYDILLLSGGDLNIQGNPSSNFSFSGTIAAHDQFTISGNPKMSGGVIAENAKYADQYFFFDNIMEGKSDVNFLTVNQISGEPDIYGTTSIGGGGAGGEGDPVGANLKGWREAIE